MSEDLEYRIKELEQLVREIAVQPKAKPSFIQKIMFKLSEQGSQRGLTLIVSAMIPYLGLPSEITLQMMGALFMIIGTHDTITEG
jgi:hypothetical protein